MNIQQARQQAQDENTPPDILAELAKIEDDAVRQGVTSNPNTPTEILIKFGAIYPRELLNNPIFNLLFLEDIDLLHKNYQAKKTLRSLLRQKDVPQFIINNAGESRQRQLKLVMANQLETSEEALKKLTASEHSEVAQAAKLHIKLAGELKGDYNKKAIQKISWDIFMVANCFYLMTNIRVFPEELMLTVKHICTDNQQLEYSFRQYLSQSPVTHPSILKKILQFPRVSKINIALNPSTPIETLKDLAKQANKYLRQHIAKHPKTPLSLLKTLAKDTDSDVAKVAKKRILIQDSEYDYYLKNPSDIANDADISSQTLTQLAKDYPDLVASHSHTPIDVLVELAYHDNVTTRINVARNVNTPLEILFRVLIKDARVKQSLAYTLSDEKLQKRDRGLTVEEISDIFTEEIINSVETILQRLVNGCGEEGKLFLASHPDLPAKFLVNLAKTSKPKTQQAVAKNLNTPIETLKELANSVNTEVHAGLAKNPNTPNDILNQLFKRHQSGDLKIRFDIYAHPNVLMASIVQSFFQDGVNVPNPANYLEYDPDFLRNNSNLRTVVLNFYARLQDKFQARESFFPLQQPEIYPEILEQKSHAVEWITRFAVAKNPKTPKETLQELANDCNQLVRAAAKHTLSSLT